MQEMAKRTKEIGTILLLDILITIFKELSWINSKIKRKPTYFRYSFLPLLIFWVSFVNRYKL